VVAANRVRCRRAPRAVNAHNHAAHRKNGPCERCRPHGPSVQLLRGLTHAHILRSAGGVSRALSIANHWTGSGGPSTPAVRPLGQRTMAVDVPIRGDDYMDDTYNPWNGFDLWPEEYAMGARSSEQTFRYRESGGPQLIRHRDHWIQVGVASVDSSILRAPSRPASWSWTTPNWPGSPARHPPSLTRGAMPAARRQLGRTRSR
jgi:hypothetical protein